MVAYTLFLAQLTIKSSWLIPVWLATLACAQDLTVRVGALPQAVSSAGAQGSVSARITPVAHAPELTVVLVGDTLETKDIEPVRTFINGIAMGLRGGFALSLTTLSGAILDGAGPYRSTNEIRSALRKISLGRIDAQVQGPTAFLADLAYALRAQPQNSEWTYVLVVGRPPSFQADVDPESIQYTVAWVARELALQKRSLLFWNPGGTPQPSYMGDVALYTGGFAIEKPADVASEMNQPSSAIALDWNLPAPSKGFRLDTITTDGVPELRSQKIPAVAALSPAAQITPAQYLELRALTATATGSVLKADIDKALALNPADWVALKFGIEVAMKATDGANAAVLLRRAVEVRPQDGNLWSMLGDLEFDDKDFIHSEADLLRARSLGITAARIAERLGRIRLAAQDNAGAETFLEESLATDAKQQQLWFLLSDLAGARKDTIKQARALEQGVLLGGEFPERRAKLIRIYLAKDDRVNAGRSADAGLSLIQDNADALVAWAGFYGEMARQSDALSCWKRVVVIDPKRELAHAAISEILLDRKLYSEVLVAVETGLRLAADSPRLQLARAIALEKTERVYEARRSLDVFSKKTRDLKLLEYNASLADAHGGDAPVAYRRFAEAVALVPERQPDLERALNRGLQVSLRDRDKENEVWFLAKLSPSSKSATKIAVPSSASGRVAIPGGFDALMFIAGGHAGLPPERFLTEYCRTVISNEESLTSAGTELYRRNVTGYFEQLRLLISLGQKGVDRTIVVVSLNDKASQKHTEAVLRVLGWKMRRNKGQISIESGEKASQAAKQDLASALAIDQAGMQKAFQEAKVFRVEIPWEWAKLGVEERLIRTVAPYEKLAGGLAEAIVGDRDLAMFYLGLSTLDQNAASHLVDAVGIGQLAGKYSLLLSLYASSLAVKNQRVVVPGGASAESIWAKLTGASPADPTRFLRGLLEKDDGKLLVFYFVASQLDREHQQFLTLTQHRASSFYEAFKNSPDLQAGGNRLLRHNTFSNFFRGIPLENGSVAFPGSPELWMVAKGTSKNAGNMQKILRKAHKTVAPDQEDEILLHIAGTTYKGANERLSEVSNFLAVARIDAHRDEYLDEESALLLAQNYGAYASFYPYFSVFKQLTLDDFKAFFQYAQRADAMSASDANLALGLFFSATELVRLSLEFGQIPEASANRIFRALCVRFNAAQDASAYTSASLEALRDLVNEAESKNGATDQVLQALVTGAGKPILLEWNGVAYDLDVAKRRATAYLRVLELQKATAVAPLLAIDESARAIASRKGDTLAAIRTLEANVPLVAGAELPKGLKMEGRAKQALVRTSVVHLPQLVADLRQRTLKKKLDMPGLEKTCRQLLAEIAPQVLIAMTGIVYAAYLTPEDSLVANDPLLLRKHQTFDLASHQSKVQRFVRPDLIAASGSEGSAFVGNFAGFGSMAGKSASTTSRNDMPDARVFVAQLASIRMTPWARYADRDQQLAGMKIRIAREWCVYAAGRPELLESLGEETVGILSIARRRDLLNSVAARDWDSVWPILTHSDLLFLADRYLARYSQGPWNSPVDVTLRRMADRPSSNLLGSVPLTLNGCDHPHLVRFAPYEEYEQHLFPEEIAERTAEFKIYLADLLDRMGLPASGMGALAEPVMRLAFENMKMSDAKDWASVLRAFNTTGPKAVEKALESLR